MRIDSTVPSQPPMEPSQALHRHRPGRHHRAQHAASAPPTAAGTPASTSALTDATQPNRPSATSEPAPGRTVEGGRLMGDMNGDGKVDQTDVDAFVLALTDRKAYVARYGEENYKNGDFHGTGTITFADIDAFQEVLSRGVKA